MAATGAGGHLVSDVGEREHVPVFEDFERHVHAHPFAIRAGFEAMGFWHAVKAHCRSYGMGERITSEVAAWLAGSAEKAQRLAARLVESLLWIATDGGWVFSEIRIPRAGAGTATRPLSAEVTSVSAKLLTKRQRDAERQRKHRKRRRGESPAQLSLVPMGAEPSIVTLVSTTPASSEFALSATDGAQSHLPGVTAGAPSRVTGVTECVTSRVTARDAGGGKGGEFLDLSVHSLESLPPSCPSLDLWSGSEPKKIREEQNNEEITPLTPRDVSHASGVTCPRDAMTPSAVPTLRKSVADPSMVLGAYREGVRLGLCEATRNYATTVSDFRGAAWKDVERIVAGHAPANLSEQETLDWVTETAKSYVIATYPKREFQRGFHPAKCGEWLNAGRPRATLPSLRKTGNVQPPHPDAPWIRAAMAARPRSVDTEDPPRRAAGKVP